MCLILKLCRVKLKYTVALAIIRYFCFFLNNNYWWWVLEIYFVFWWWSLNCRKKSTSIGIFLTSIQHSLYMVVCSNIEWTVHLPKQHILYFFVCVLDHLKKNFYFKSLSRVEYWITNKWPSIGTPFPLPQHETKFLWPTERSKTIVVEVLKSPWRVQD